MLSSHRENPTLGPRPHLSDVFHALPSWNDSKVGLAAWWRSFQVLFQGTLSSTSSVCASLFQLIDGVMSLDLYSKGSVWRRKSLVVTVSPAKLSICSVTSIHSGMSRRVHASTGVSECGCRTSTHTSQGSWFRLFLLLFFFFFFLHFLFYFGTIRWHEIKPMPHFQSPKYCN